jgi:hypothetical protein
MSINIKLLVAIAAIALTISSVFYYTSHREITDANTLSIRAIDASKDTKSYRFAISTNLSMPAQGDVIDMLSGEGCVDYRNKKMRSTITTMDRSVEVVVIGDTAYTRESNGSWQMQELGGYHGSMWERDDDVLAQQRSILLNATNATMHKEDNGWVLDIIPDKEEVLKQMRKTGKGLETIREEELKDFSIRYWIEKDSYHIMRVENRVELEMNIGGMVTPMQLGSSVYFDSYNEKMEIEAPI